MTDRLDKIKANARVSAVFLKAHPDCDVDTLVNELVSDTASLVRKEIGEWLDGKCTNDNHTYCGCKRIWDCPLCQADIVDALLEGKMP